MEEILFTKMHGLGNDYIYINCLASTPRDIPQLAIEMSRHHFGIGSDGIILICPSEVADFRMRIFNADGSEARMCGNGSRCVGKYVHDYGLTDLTTITLETLGGIKTIELHTDASGQVASATVDMGVPDFSTRAIPAAVTDTEMIRYPIETDMGTVEVTGVSMGNPHGVVVCSDPSAVDLHRIGPELEHHTVWPERANIEFIAVHNPHEITMRVWERGSGETMACGTGACASAAVARQLGLTADDVTVHLPGGDLRIRLTDSGHVLMTGPATTTFEGRYFRSTQE
ncbi:MAG: diaminopimelate epimerase [Bacteroides sp.]|nr:diaminopimelate epimerase [Bacteroides sp.]MCM1414078.1 diaminopimelate epimerase [Bacteroides sp.]MCM1472323.1 diaminopimelate epimerase [Bacteroides sp.]